jgi:hypothetical protein
MSNRFHNKYHRDNHHSKRTAKNNSITDAAFDPIASYAEPFQGEFFSDGEIVTNSFLSAAGNVYAQNGVISDNLTVSGNLSVLGEFSRLDTYVYVTSAMDITNQGTGPALRVTQTGMQPIAHFIDAEGDDIVFNNNGYVGLGIMNPSEKLMVIGNTVLSGNAVVADKLYFGTNGIASDTNLYRANTNILKTDDKLAIGTVDVDGTNNDILVIGADGTIRKRAITGESWNTPANFLSGVNLTLDYVPKYGDTQKFVNSIIYNEGMRVGIDNNNPLETLDVNGTVLFSTASANVFEVIGKGTPYTDGVKGVATIYSESTGAAGGNVLKVGSATNPVNLVVKDNGRVGINDDIPEENLHVVGSYLQTVDGSGDYIIKIQDGSGRINHYWNTTGTTTPTFKKGGDDATKILFGGQGQPILQASTSQDGTGVVAGTPITWTTPFTILRNGNVGVGNGMINPTRTLHVSSVDLFNTRFESSHINATVVEIKNNNKVWENAVAGSANLAGVPLGSYYILDQAEGPRMVIDFIGNVGIGTTTPNSTARLQVSGGSIMPQIGSTSDTGIQFPSDPGNGGGDTAYIRYYARPGEGENTTFEIGTTNDADDHISLMASGNVGIGTYYPNKDLTVAGEISSYNVRVNQGAPNNNDNSTNGYSFGIDGDTGVFSPFGPGGAGNGNVSLYSNNVEILRSNGTNGVTIFQNLSVTGEIRGNKAFRAVQGAPNDGNNSTNGYAFEVDGNTGIFSPFGPGGMGNGIVSTYSNGEEVLRVSAPGGIVFYYNLSSVDAAIRATVGAPNSNNLSTNGYGFGEDGDTGVFSPVLTAGANNGVVSLYSNSNEILRASDTNGVTIFHNLSVTGTINGVTPNAPIPIGSFSPTNASHDQTYICSPGAGVTVTITLPAGLNPGTQFSVIRAGDVGGFVEFTNAVGVAVPRSSPDNTFNNLAFVNSVASAYFAGTVDGTANVWYLLGDLLP